MYCWVKAAGRRGGQETAANCTGWADDCRHTEREREREGGEKKRGWTTGSGHNDKEIENKTALNGKVRAEWMRT